MSKEKAIEKKFVEKFEKKMIKVQDMHRGIPKDKITEVEAARRSLGRKIIEENPGIKKELEKVEKARSRSEEEIEGMQKERRDPLPFPSDILDKLDIYELCTCDGSIRNFDLPFIRGIASGHFNAESPVNDVQQGLVGWSSSSNPSPVIKNTGSGDGQHENGELALYWRATVPNDGIFALRPDQNISSFPVYGSHKVRGQGWFLSSNDARVEVHAWVIVYLDGEWLTAHHVPVSSDATKSENRTQSFADWVDLPGRITFEANEGQQLGMIVRLRGNTWANDEGLAELNISSFGIPANTIEDVDLIVKD